MLRTSTKQSFLRVAQSWAMATCVCALSACGSSNNSDKAGVTATTVLAGNASELPSATQSRMAQQGYTSSQDHADNAEIVATGDNGQASASVSKMATSVGINIDASFSFDGGPGHGHGGGNANFSGNANGDNALNANVAMSGNIDFKNPPPAFSGAFHFMDHKAPSGAVESGTINMDVNNVGNSNFTMVFASDLNQLLPDHSTISIQGDPNVIITRDGNRAEGVVTKTINGTEHRKRVAANGNVIIDFTIDHNNLVIVDDFAASSATNANATLAKRTVNGTNTIKDNISGTTSVNSFTNLSRSNPDNCLCPTGGSVTQTLTLSGGTSKTYTYAFGSTCGEVDVTLEGSATTTTTTSAGNANAMASGTAKARGKLGWEMCVPAK